MHPCKTASALACTCAASRHMNKQQVHLRIHQLLSLLITCMPTQQHTQRRAHWWQRRCVPDAHKPLTKFPLPHIKKTNAMHLSCAVSFVIPIGVAAATLHRQLPHVARYMPCSVTAPRHTRCFQTNKRGYSSLHLSAYACRQVKTAGAPIAGRP
jgi:hypothetical protein